MMQTFCGKSVVNVAAYCDESMREELELSAKIRDWTLTECLRIPSYKYKSLEWKNRYYDVIKKKVEKYLREHPHAQRITIPVRVEREFTVEASSIEEAETIVKQRMRNEV